MSEQKNIKAESLFSFESSINDNREPISIKCKGRGAYPDGLKMMIGDKEIDLAQACKIVITIGLNCLPCVEVTFI